MIWIIIAILTMNPYQGLHLGTLCIPEVHFPFLTVSNTNARMYVALK